MAPISTAPLHYDALGESIAAVALEPYLGPARVIDLRGHQGEIHPEHVAGALDASVRRVLLRTFDRFPSDRWVSDFATPTAATIRFLDAAGVVVIGVDAPSIDPETSKTLHAHHAIRAARADAGHMTMVGDREASLLRPVVIGSPSAFMSELSRHAA